MYTQTMFSKKVMSPTSFDVQNCSCSCSFDPIGKLCWRRSVCCAICGRTRFITRMIKCDGCQRSAHPQCALKKFVADHRDCQLRELHRPAAATVDTATQTDDACGRVTTRDVACGPDDRDTWENGRPAAATVDAATQTDDAGGRVTTRDVACGPDDRDTWENGRPVTSVVSAIREVASDCSDRPLVDCASQTGVAISDVFASGDDTVSVNGNLQTTVAISHDESGEKAVSVNRGVVDIKAKQIMNEFQQRESYAKRRFKSNTHFEPGDKVLLNLGKYDRKGGPFTIELVSDDNTCVLKRGNKLLKTRQHLKNIKNVHEYAKDSEDKKLQTCVLSSEENVNPRWFRPIGKCWMIKRCKQMNIDVNTIKCKIRKSSKPLTNPKDFIDVLGDGNCWYRCISVWITGFENYHTRIRNELYKFYYTDCRVQRFVGGNLDDYLDECPLHIPGTWATEVEIFATAIMLNTNIYVYSACHKSWLLFGKNGENIDAVKFNENCIYIAHINSNHYQVVADTI